MHGKGQIIWQDGRKYTGVINPINLRNMRTIKNMVRVSLNGQMAENTSEHGLMV